MVYMVPVDEKRQRRLVHHPHHILYTDKGVRHSLESGGRLLF
jgi:hypothetical protein